MSVFAALCLLFLQTGALGFKIGSNPSMTHEEITEKAILDITVQACRSLALAEGKDFPMPAHTPDAVVVACEAPKSAKNFRRAIKLIQARNMRVDIRYFYDSNYHFDAESFAGGKRIVTEGLSAIKANIRKESFKSARKTLGRILHPTQDFYSHSNWVEMGNKLPNSNLIRAGNSIGKVAGKNRATCRSCKGNNCADNILEDILREKILTSGYFGLVSSSKPKGKCSHGDDFDQTSDVEPTGGINKDSFSSAHGHLHSQAAMTALSATSELLEDIRRAAGDKQFLQMLGISRRSSKALCFVIDTTGSMSDDIEAVKDVTASIIDSKVGTEEEPSEYLLVPFSDPDYGPLTRTTDPKLFQKAVNSLRASGGGDTAELGLSGLRMALTAAPSNSEMFFFTDAPAKDYHLKSAVIALIEQTKAVVNFMVTGFLRGPTQSDDNHQQQYSSWMLKSNAQLYRDLAQASGGQAIQVSKSQLPLVATIITESSSASLVTLVQAARNPGGVEFNFLVDESIRNLTVYITGNWVTCTLTSPSGITQQSTDSTGSLITSSLSAGNFKTLKLKREEGLWGIKMASTNSYTVKVVGESPIDFLFDFYEKSQGPFGGLEVLENRPRAGGNSSVLVTVTGTESATVTEVILVQSSGAGEVHGRVEAQGGGDFLAHFDRIPSEEFVVLVKGQNSKGSSKASSLTFQRQSTTTVQVSNVVVTADESNNILEPGSSLSVPFTVTSGSAGGTFTIRASNDQGFALSFPSSLSLVAGGSANATVKITAPLSTVSGTDVTLTVEAEAPGGSDSNYVVLSLTVLKKVTDFTEPQCKLISLQSNCSDDCHSSMWELSVQVTDGTNGTGIDSITVRQGNGAMNSSLSSDYNNTTLVSYNATCCSPDVELVVVDKVGNAGVCFYTVRSAAAGSLSAGGFQLLVLCLGIVILGLN